MPDSGKFKDLYLNSAHTYPCQERGWGCLESHPTPLPYKTKSPLPVGIALGLPAERPLGRS